MKHFSHTPYFRRGILYFSRVVIEGNFLIAFYMFKSADSTTIHRSHEQLAVFCISGRAKNFRIRYCYTNAFHVEHLNLFRIKNKPLIYLSNGSFCFVLRPFLIIHS